MSALLIGSGPNCWSSISFLSASVLSCLRKDARRSGIRGKSSGKQRPGGISGLVRGKTRYRQSDEVLPQRSPQPVLSFHTSRTELVDAGVACELRTKGKHLFVICRH